MNISEKEKAASVATAQALARQDLGLYQPDNLQEALSRIAQANNPSSWSLDNQSPADPAQTVAYFLGQEILCGVWRHKRYCSPAAPFKNMEKLHIPVSRNPQDVLLLGCAGAESYALEQAKLQEAGIEINRHWTVDISALPLRRIAATVPGIETGSLIQADAATIPLSDRSIDLVLTDLFFGSQSRSREKIILKEVARVMKDDGQLVLRASVLSSSDLAFFQQITNAGFMSIGLECIHGIANPRAYGMNKLTGRDNYIGLTPSQWLELGHQSLNFILKHYYGRNRFTKLEQIYQFLEAGSFSIKEKVEEEVYLKGLSSYKYVAIRAEKN